MAEPRERLGSGRLLRGLLVALTLVATFGFVWLRFRAPAPVAVDAAPELFSAERALVQLRVLLGDGRPHPMGSPANAAVGERIINRLRVLGYQPEVQRGFSCGRYRRCSEVQNIVVTMEGGPDAVLLVAHYDSVPAGPGAADDGAAVAALLEVARVLADRPARRNTVVLLIDDGEEEGLLGAELFMAKHPMAKRARVVVNLEARGTSGPSMMFETAGPTAGLVRLLAGALDRPITSSLFSAVYERMPNDTDLTVFREGGVAGYNFAFLDDARHYHTRQDDLQHLSTASLQHHGDNALALLHALADADLATLSQGGDAVWFDLLGFGVVRWPRGWSLPLALLATALLAAGAAGAARRQPQFWRGVGWSLGAAIVAIVLATVASALVVTMLAAAGLVHQFGSNSVLVLVAVPAASAAVVGCLLVWTTRLGCRSAAARYAGVWSLWAFLTMAVALLFPEGSYLFIGPALVAGVVARPAGGSTRDGWWAWLAALAPLLVMALLWFTVVLALVAAVGLIGQVAIGAAFGLMAAVAIPVLGLVLPPRPLRRPQP
jgi:hypothetical protein